MKLTVKPLTPNRWPALEAYPLDADETTSTSFTATRQRSHTPASKPSRVASPRDRSRVTI
jgi:hypothetical protein